jgi:hypothetical protein
MGGGGEMSVVNEDRDSFPDALSPCVDQGCEFWDAESGCLQAPNKPDVCPLGDDYKDHLGAGATE